MTDLVIVVIGMLGVGACCYLWGRQEAEHACGYHRARADRLARELAAAERERDAAYRRRGWSRA